MFQAVPFCSQFLEQCLTLIVFAVESLFTASSNCYDLHPEFTREQFKVAGKKHFQSVDLKTWDTTFGGHANHDGCDDDDGDDTLLMGLMKKADILATEGKV